MGSSLFLMSIRDVETLTKVINSVKTRQTSLFDCQEQKLSHVYPFNFKVTLAQFPKTWHRNSPDIEILLHIYYYYFVIIRSLPLIMLNWGQSKNLNCRLVIFEPKAIEQLERFYKCLLQLMEFLNNSNFNFEYFVKDKSLGFYKYSKLWPKPLKEYSNV